MPMRSGRTRPAAVRTSVVCTGFAVAAMLTGGCTQSHYGDPDPNETAGSAAPPGPADTRPPPQIVGRELPVALTGPQQGVMDFPAMDRAAPRAPDGASVLEQVTAELRRETLFKAAVYGDITARCEGGRVVVAPRAVTNCTTTYEGVEIPWQVTMDENSVPGSMLMSYYTLEPGAALVTAKSVYDSFWRAHGETEQPRCDTLPPAFRAEPGTSKAAKDTGYHCQYLDSADEHNVRRWVDVPIVVDEDGAFTFRT